MSLENAQGKVLRNWGLNAPVESSGGGASIPDIEDCSLTLNGRPDGYGFIYGTLLRGDDQYRVNIMPPAREWSGDTKLDGFEPHETDWVIYVNGDEIGRIGRNDQQEVKQVIAQRLASGPVPA